MGYQEQRKINRIIDKMKKKKYIECAACPLTKICSLYQNTTQKQRRFLKIRRYNLVYLKKLDIHIDTVSANAMCIRELYKRLYDLCMENEDIQID